VETYLLILRWLSAKYLSKTGEGLLILKDLLTVFLSSDGVTFSGFAGD
jgi:hypothetical protein